MSYFEPSKLLAGQARFSKKMESAEWRMPDTAVLSALSITEKGNPAIANLRLREDRLAYAYLPIKSAAGSAVKRTYNHTGNSPDSKAVQLSWNSIVETFSLSADQFLNNIISFEDAYASGILNGVQNILARQEALMLASLLGDVTQINKGRVQGTWNATENFMEINNEEKFLANIMTSMKNNGYQGQLMVIQDSLAYINSAHLKNQGTQNAVNSAYQFGNANIVMTSASIDDSYLGSALAFPVDMAGIIPWIPAKNREPLNPEKATNSVIGDYGSFTVPVLDDKGNTVYNLPIAISVYTGRADAESRNGSAQDDLMQIELSLDMAYVSAPLSTVRATGDWAGKTDSVVY